MRVLLWLLLGAILVDVLSVVPGWLAGRPPARPAGYERTAAFALTLVPNVCSQLLPPVGRAAPRWRRWLPAALIALSFVGVAWYARLR